MISLTLASQGNALTQMLSLNGDQSSRELRKILQELMITCADVTKKAITLAVLQHFPAPFRASKMNIFVNYLVSVARSASYPPQIANTYSFPRHKNWGVLLAYEDENTDLIRVENETSSVRISNWLLAAGSVCCEFAIDDGYPAFTLILCSIGLILNGKNHFGKTSSSSYG